MARRIIGASTDTFRRCSGAIFSVVIRFLQKVAEGVVHPRSSWGTRILGLMSDFLAVECVPVSVASRLRVRRTPWSRVRIRVFRWLAPRLFTLVTRQAAVLSRVLPRGEASRTAVSTDVPRVRTSCCKSTRCGTHTLILRTTPGWRPASLRCELLSRHGSHPLFALPRPVATRTGGRCVGGIEVFGLLTVQNYGYDLRPRAHRLDRASRGARVAVGRGRDRTRSVGFGPARRRRVARRARRGAAPAARIAASASGRPARVGLRTASRDRDREIRRGQHLPAPPRFAPAAPFGCGQMVAVQRRGCPPTDRCGNSSSSWNRMPTRRASGGRPVMSRPSSRTRPRTSNAGATVPTITDRSVDFPDPDAPMTVSIVPGATWASSARSRVPTQRDRQVVES